MNADVVTIGESMVLFHSINEGSLNYSSLFTTSIAGAESNISIALTRLGRKVRWISRLGTDPFGDKIASTLAGEGVDVSHVIRDADYPTAVYFKENKGLGDPSIYYYRKGSAASRLTEKDVSDAWFDGAKHLHVTGITPALGTGTKNAVSTAMRRARERGMTISFDPNLRRKLWSETEARETLLSLIPLCDLFMPGLEEAEFLLGSKTVDSLGAQFLQRGASVVAIKLGVNGSIAFTAEGSFSAAPYPVSRVVDSVGAGDAFAAGFLSVLLESVDSCGSPAAYSLELLGTALDRANLMGSLATQFRGDWEGLPKREELERIRLGQQHVTR